MTFKSKTPPHCLWCNKAIPKYTENHSVLTPREYGRRFDDPTVPRTKADCQKLINAVVVSVDYNYETDINYDRTGRRVVHSYSTWDGESYKDEYFCNGDHARCFGYAAAAHGLRFKKRNAA
jgi:hypothetical protein